MPTYSTMMVMSAQQCKFCLLLFLFSILGYFFLLFTYFIISVNYLCPYILAKLHRYDMLNILLVLWAI